MTWLVYYLPPLFALERVSVLWLVLRFLTGLPFEGSPPARITLYQFGPLSNPSVGPQTPLELTEANIGYPIGQTSRPKATSDPVLMPNGKEYLHAVHSLQ